MTGFKPRISGIGSNHSANWATTTAPNIHLNSYISTFYTGRSGGSRCLIPLQEYVNQKIDTNK